MRRTMTAAALVGAAMVLGTAGPVAAAPLPDAAPAGTAEAVRDFGAFRIVVGGCGPRYLGADGVVTADGSARGFASCVREGGPIRFFDRAGDGTVRPSEATGFAGEVLAVTADAGATYLLYRTARTLFVGKRTDAGAYSSRAVGFDADRIVNADLIARDGRWLGVWSAVTIGREPGQFELYQGGSGQAQVRRITTTAPAAGDFDPALAYQGATPVLVWTRNDSVTGRAALRIAEQVGGAWRSRPLTAAGRVNYDPDVAVAGGSTFVTWIRDGRVVVAGNSGGSFASRQFAVPGFRPRVAASTTAGGAVDAVFVAYQAAASGQPFFAETRQPGGSVSGTWNGRYLLPPAGYPVPPVALGGAEGRATVVLRTDTTLLAARQN